ncbi:bifunctional 2-C-methyl-D-erythritol 4-phosphate cytidylyltransferase/2-C-methyl-D-erythritol 2,4-cyclodiphosphate synthase [Alkalibacillus aidingensis]|uniref:bifunctional 2-C-methyl-D-erythritol 4-phosphate cytidylyltransferase/2-C-methyl-D-erythritol 2,4-cyclodiphosphate synthase n=1 Tax=Alkalibacillus aidingensis TaxID=2747607 RepID=UPI00166163CF|nr:bifunctional 2-C-methyl-D-erythritol 4-phosphate cytidylyltransferase/2-C-methyl-D-erythritol 2,4-cyclodiphosphate synthase [Alkalibacillus aidingensis]
MGNYQAIILAAGQGKRMKAGKNKQLIMLGDRPLIAHTLAVFENDPWCQFIYLVVHPDEQATMKEVIERYQFQKIKQVVLGGKERQDSVRAAVKALKDSLITFVHDGARPFVTQEELHRLYNETKQQEAALLAVPVTDTIKQVNQGEVKTLNRDQLYSAQTPQAFSFNVLKKAHEYAETEEVLATDDVALLEFIGYNPSIVEGSYNNFKLTTPEDIQKAENMLKINRQEMNKEEPSLLRIGHGFDVHQLVEGRPCIIGGVTIPYEKGLLGHSDADVLLHTVADALLGTIGAGDIGKHFPDDDPKYKHFDSKELLKEVWEKVKQEGYTLGNVDCTIMAQAPKMSPYIEEMRTNIAKLLNAEKDQVNVKATTTEKLGFTGRGEGIASQAVVLVQRQD